MEERVAVVVVGISGYTTKFLLRKRLANGLQATYKKLTNTQEFEEIYFQVSIYGTTLSVIEIIEADVASVLYNSLTALNVLLTNYTATQISLQFRTNLKIDEKFWQNVLRYKLGIK